MPLTDTQIKGLKPAEVDRLMNEKPISTASELGVRERTVY